MKIGVDIGGTEIKAGILANGKIIKKLSIRTEANKGKKQVIKNITEIIERLFDKKIKSIGIGAPGPLDYKKGILGKQLNLPLSNFNLKKYIQQKFKVSVAIDNDANVFTLGEAVYGAERNNNNVVGLTLGTGIGGGVVINKKIYHGRGNAGELGHITIKFDEKIKSKCGNNGCIEQYISAEGICRRAKIKSPLELYNLAVKGNKKAISDWDETGRLLGIGITNIINSFDPDIIIIGGNISKAWKFFFRSMQKEIKKRSFLKGVKVVRTKLGEDAAIIGAASLV